ncbi:hypothetical protein P168DRAFT_315912 [Aspergillus campestris IBT 28561]|uniref:Uncharacterized protein n=1 Tax=Aspergillus campestris (strain IBT 28561) TaxID=1392248 RepID=A0A2I1DBY9_ASPC2|nr:uncharacterized protein P168DRAFT_315912 [Aspergillus campestris IBT 28561]PKY07402.1 hypothetical protein P168DRAFT_315912 [Aspergillus campestris IBT 28561]
MGWPNPHGSRLDRRGDLKNAILQVLNPVEPRGPFLSVADGEPFVLPGLEVDGIGPIGLPVSPHEAQALISAGRPSAHVGTTKTIDEAHAPKRWELDGDKFTFANPAWEAHVKMQLSHALSKLGLNADAREVEMRPHKIFIDEKDRDELRQAFTEFLPRILESFQFEGLEWRTGLYDDDDDDDDDLYGLLLRKEPHMKPLDPEILRQFIQSYEELIGYGNLTDETAPIYSALIKHAKQLPEAKKAIAFGEDLLPFLIDYCKWMGFEIGVPPQSYETDFAVAVLDEYLNSCMRAPPERPVQLDELLSKYTCACWDCSRLQVFLGDSNQRVATFRVTAAKRRHLEARLRPLLTTLTVFTIYSGPPYTLQVEKPSTEYEKNKAATEWVTNVNQFQGYMRKLKQNYAEEAIGADRFRALCNHPNLQKPDWVREAVVRPVDGASIQPSPQSVSPWQQGSLTSRKRPFADII